MTLLVPGGDLRGVITALVDDELATVWSDDPALGWSSEALAITDGKAISPGARSDAWIERSALRERILVERAAEHPVWWT